MKVSHLILPKIHSGISTVFICTQTWQVNSLILESGFKVVRISPCHFLYRFCSDKIIYSSKLKFSDIEVLVSYKFLRILKELWQSKNFQEYRPIGRYLVPVRVCVGTASQIQTFVTRWKWMLPYRLFAMYRWERRQCAPRVVGWMSYKGGQKFGEDQKEYCYQHRNTEF